jgi:hypothetical protein
MRDVQLRMYLLSGLRGDDAGWALPELWRRIGGSSQTPGREAGAISRIHRAHGQIGRLRRSLSLAGTAIAVGVVGGNHD